jgi:hypothetical protein
MKSTGNLQVTHAFSHPAVQRSNETKVAGNRLAQFRVQQLRNSRFT